ncbi:MAG: hypothetical protein Q9192_005764, partial [Flavoplaca navasiana]
LRERKKRYFLGVDDQVEQGRGLTDLNATQRYYARIACPDLYYGRSEDNRRTGGHRSLSADVAVLLEILKNQSGGHDGSTTLETSERRNENLLSLGNNTSNHVDRRDDLAKPEFRMKVRDGDYNTTQRDSQDELTAVRLTSFNTQIKRQPLVHPCFKATIAENNQGQEKMKPREHRTNQRTENIEAATKRVGDNDLRTDPNPLVPVAQPSAAQNPIQPPVSCDFHLSNSTLRGRNFLAMSRKQKKNKKRLRDKRRKQEEETAAQVEIEAGSLMEAPPLDREFIAGSEDIPSGIENLTPAIPSSEPVMAPPAPHLNATLGIERKYKAYERVSTRLCYAHIDANIYIKEIAKDTQDQSTTEKLTKLCDRMTTAKDMALRSLRGHPDALERVGDSLRGMTR